MSGATRVGGRDTTTFWGPIGDALGSRNLWLLVAALEVALTLLSPFPADVRRPALNIAAGLVSSVVLLAVIWCGWTLLLKRLTGAMRVAAAVPIIVLAGVARGAVLQSMLIAWGMSQPGVEGYSYRISVSVTVVVLGSATGALVKTAVDGQRTRLERLAKEQERLSLVLAQAEADVQRDQSGAIATIRSDLAVQLAQVQAASPVLAIDSLEQLAASVVRPLSHELASKTPTWDPPELSTVSQRLEWSKVWGTMASVGAINPWAPALFILILTPTSVIILGVKSGVLLHLVAACLVYVGLMLVRASCSGLAARQSTSIRMAVTTALLIVACVPAALATLLFPGTSSSNVINSLYIFIVVPLIALLLSFVRAARTQQREIDEAVNEIVNETRWWVSRTRMVGWWQRGTLARALHGPVQSAIHAAVQRLRVAVDSGTATPDQVESVLDDVRRSLPDVVIQGDAAADVAYQLAEISLTWQPLVDVQFELDAVAEDSLHTDQLCGEIAVSTAGEAVSDAVRHGGARQVRISLTSTEDNILSVVVTDDGRGRERASGDREENSGLGTSQLDTCAVAWSYAVSSDVNCLQVQLPLLQST